MTQFKKVVPAFLLLLPLMLSSFAAQSDLLATTFYHNDALGSPVAATDDNGTVLWREEYRPFGDKIINDPNAEENTRWYTGHPHDQETGLTYAGARYYDPVVGRFMGIDPVGFTENNPMMFNRYAYANNNPYGLVDPDGRSPIKLRDLKVALKEVHKKLGGKLQKGKDGKFGSAQHGDSTKGYRLDKQGHPNARQGTPDADGPHINWWDFSKMKKKTATSMGLENEVSGAVRVGNTVKDISASVVGAIVTGMEYVENKFPRTLGIVENLNPLSISIDAMQRGSEKTIPDA